MMSSPLLQAAGVAVQVIEIGRQPRDLAAVLIKVFDGAEGAGDDLVQRLQPGRQAPLRHLHQAGFRRSQHLQRRLALVRRPRNRLRADQHEPPQQALVLDDADVFFDDRPPRQTLSERGQIGNSAYRFDLLEARQFVGQRYNVDGALRQSATRSSAGRSGGGNPARSRRLPASQRLRRGPRYQARWRPG